MSSSRWPRSPSHGKCCRRFCGSSQNCGRSRREAFDGYAFKSNRQKECVPNDRKISGSTARPPFGPPVVRVAARSSRLASREARKSLLFTPVRESSGECRLKARSGIAAADFLAALALARRLCQLRRQSAILAMLRQTATPVNEQEKKRLAEYRESTKRQYEDAMKGRPTPTPARASRRF